MRAKIGALLLALALLTGCAPKAPVEMVNPIRFYVCAPGWKVRRARSRRRRWILGAQILRSMRFSRVIWLPRRLRFRKGWSVPR